MKSAEPKMAAKSTADLKTRYQLSVRSQFLNQCSSTLFIYLRVSVFRTIWYPSKLVLVQNLGKRNMPLENEPRGHNQNYSEPSLAIGQSKMLTANFNGGSYEHFHIMVQLRKSIEFEMFILCCLKCRRLTIIDMFFIQANLWSRIRYVRNVESIVISTC